MIRWKFHLGGWLEGMKIIPPDYFTFFYYNITMNTNQVSISKAKNMKSHINIEADIISKGKIKTVKLKDGKTVELCETMISNNYGNTDELMKFVLWGDDIDLYNIGDRVFIISGYTTEYKGEKSLTKGKFGTIQLIPQNNK